MQRLRIQLFKSTLAFLLLLLLFCAEIVGLLATVHFSAPNGFDMQISNATKQLLTPILGDAIRFTHAGSLANTIILPIAYIAFLLALFLPLNALLNYIINHFKIAREKF
ncbi:MAG: hypothetical protein LBL41_05950, partial [Bifidobacteriaceae bacterium]|nr:hypothetical protein [Bifidobacteriaceae bacterium]